MISVGSYGRDAGCQCPNCSVGAVSMENSSGPNIPTDGHYIQDLDAYWRQYNEMVRTRISVFIFAFCTCCVLFVVC